jgi:hypothetical protein
VASRDKAGFSYFTHLHERKIANALTEPDDSSKLAHPSPKFKADLQI